MLVALGGSLSAQPTPVPLPFLEFSTAPGPPVTMPNLVGLPQSEAEKIARELQVEQVQVITIASGDPGRVVRQMPEVGQPTRMAYLYIGSAAASESKAVSKAPLRQEKPQAESLPAGVLFGLGQLVLLAFAWVGWYRIEEQARSRPLDGQLKGRGQC